VVPDSFTGYFAGAATAAGALIGLLFVAVSLRPEAVLGAGASAKAQAVASPGRQSLVYAIAYLLVASFAAALGRAWSLMQGRDAPGGGKPSCRKAKRSAAQSAAISSSGRRRLIG
jgi:hypothetical protein